MFPEFRDLITKLKAEDYHFSRLFDKHNELDQKVQNIDAKIEFATREQVENLKKEKLRLKDEIYAILRKHAQQQ
ncbi:YdcH family protein [Necropsobacter massiliensis]|uniref:YdcH family protein n=1 Tax=Necropsobacter massiliensis TaxID=1400001 RepID=UPI000509D357|nr:YdcH family protein [Necropsobacter massiliensis]